MAVGRPPGRCSTDRWTWTSHVAARVTSLTPEPGQILSVRRCEESPCVRLVAGEGGGGLKTGRPFPPVGLNMVV